MTVLTVDIGLGNLVLGHSVQLIQILETLLKHLEKLI